MFVLALDTATPVTAVALLSDRKVLGEVSEPAKNHSRTLLPAVDRLLEQQRVERGMLNAVAVGIGPGSFTGTRVGLALAKAVAYSLGIDLVGISTLRALAENGRSRGADQICPVLDAVKGEVFGARYAEKGSQLLVVEAEAARNPWEWARGLAKEGGRFLMLGNGVLRYRGILLDVLGKSLVVPEEADLHRVKARAVGLLGLERLERGEKDDPRTLEPNYCRLSEAELARLKKPQG